MKGRLFIVISMCHQETINILRHVLRVHTPSYSIHQHHRSIMVFSGDLIFVASLQKSYKINGPRLMLLTKSTCVGVAVKKNFYCFPEFLSPNGNSVLLILHHSFHSNVTINI